MAVVFVVVAVPIVKGLSVCLDKTTKEMKLDLTGEPQDIWSKRKACFETQEALTALASCYDEVGERSFIPLEVVEEIAKLVRPDFSGLNEWINLHNTKCADFSRTLIR